MTGYIYTLSHDGIIFYVGCTLNPGSREKNHLTANKNIRSIFFQIINEVEIENKYDVVLFKEEKFWIEQLRQWGFPLINISDNLCAKRKRKVKNYISNKEYSWYQDFDYSALSKSLKNKRIDILNITLRKAAKEAGLSFTTLSRLENGIGAPNLNNVLAVCDWMDIPFCNFITVSYPDKKRPKPLLSKKEINKNFAVVIPVPLPSSKKSKK